MEFEKNVMQSLTVVSLIAAIAVDVLPMAGISFSSQDAALVNETADKIAQAVLALLAIYGRIRATKSLRILPAKKAAAQPKPAAKKPAAKQPK